MKSRLGKEIQSGKTKEFVRDHYFRRWRKKERKKEKKKYKKKEIEQSM